MCLKFELGTEDNYLANMKQAKEQYHLGDKCDRQHLKELLKESFAFRRKEIEEMEKEGEAMMSSVLLSWPSLHYGEYILWEMKHILTRKKMDMEKLMRKGNRVLEILLTMVPSTALKRKVKMIDISFHYILISIRGYRNESKVYGRHGRQDSFLTIIVTYEKPSHAPATFCCFCS